MLDAIIAWIDVAGSATNHPLVLVVLFAAAMIEYVVPPFPGDTITLLGAVLVGAYGWNLPLIFVVLMMGSVLGSALAFAVGRRWSRRTSLAASSKLQSLVSRFERHGIWLLMLNRFLPGIRPLFFVAAGLAKMPTTQVLFASALSAALWNALLMVIGASLGQNLPAIESWMRTYTLITWLLLGALALVGTAFALWRRRSSTDNC